MIIASLLIWFLDHNNNINNINLILIEPLCLLHSRCAFCVHIETAGETTTLMLAVLLIVVLAGSYNITYQLAAELFPTVVRGRGVLLSKVDTIS